MSGIKCRLTVAAILLLATTAGATITMQTTYNGQFPVQSGAAVVDSWTISFTSDSDLIAGFSAELSGPAYQIGSPASPPLQPTPFLTPTLSEAGFLPIPQADTCFLLAAADFVPAVTPPGESNDFAFGAQASGWSEGVGLLWAESGIALETQAASLDVINLALLPEQSPVLHVVIGERSGATYEFFWAPEPGTLWLLAAGAMAVIRRRRGSSPGGTRRR